MPRISDRRESVMLAHVYKPDRDNRRIKDGDWYLSLKLDGMRAFWDGGITRELLCSEVPFCNTDKHSRFLRDIRATGLWSRYYQPIQAPDWFLDRLPQYCLDGELYAGRGLFQQTMSAVKKLNPIDQEWRLIKYNVFDIPTLGNFLRSGRINLPQFTKNITEEMLQWALARMRVKRPSAYTFMECYEYLRMENFDTDIIEVIPQRLVADVNEVELLLDGAVSKGEEGLMLRYGRSCWKSERSLDLLKVKKCLDIEGTVVNYTWGKETDRGSKLLGLMGNMIVKLDNNIEFGLSGFTDEERQMITESGEDASRFGIKAPGKMVEGFIFNPLFPRGCRISIKYQELSVDGIPLKARFWRKEP